ncbi:MAG: putative secreted protein [Candidatus Phytoplasma cynodontis]|uniref:hypothetical protein n=1 Tax='Cynodon dactylon' phytoplasma TaxID=295320 RepID=UPI001265D462|nr:hypothetical protein ['Cynodon dactylon' phytoplasma]KAB8121727.1 hypothetical protein F1741_01995 ['Cynodon dactylon' phytoplasma]WIA07689.1 MAG: putative secreted protein [Candidatus Phytoplasma cynodontis]
MKKNKFQIKKNIIILLIILILIISFILLILKSYKSFFYKKSKINLKNQNKEIKINEFYKLKTKKNHKIEPKIDLNKKISYTEKIEYIVGKTTDKSRINQIDEIYKSYFESIKKYDNKLTQKFEESIINYNKKIFLNKQKIKKIKKELDNINKNLENLNDETKNLNNEILQKEKELFDKKEKLIKLKQYTFKATTLKNLEEELLDLKSKQKNITYELSKNKLQKNEFLNEISNLEQTNIFNNYEKEKEKENINFIQEINKKKISKFENMLSQTYDIKISI